MASQRGQRRHSPPPGYISSTEAVQKLGKMLYKHVEAGRIRKLTPEGYKHGYYHAGDVEAVLATEQIFSPQYVKGSWKNNPTSRITLATEAEIPEIVEISKRIFTAPPPAEIRLAWLRKNSETFHVLYNQQGTLCGFSSLLPLKPDVLRRFIRDEIESEQITADDIEVFEPGKPLQCYIMALAIDPRCSLAEKHEYGARLVNGLFSFLLDLAQRGVVIESITARTYTADGLRLLRKMGFPQLRSPAPGKNLFAVRLAESGFPIFIRYSELLERWQRQHQQPTPAQPGNGGTVATAKPRTYRTAAYREQHDLPPVTRSTYAEPADLPPGSAILYQFAAEHGIDRRKLLDYVQRHHLAHELFPKENRPGEADRYFTPQQHQALAAWLREHGKAFTPCPRCAPSGNA